MPPQTPANLKAVKSNQPQLIHSSSQQSIAASDDYYSFSDISQASNHSKVTVVRYATPPTRRPSPSPNMSSRATEDDIAGAAGSSGIIRDPEQTPRQKTVAPDVHDGARVTESGTPSPGVDDMPYIRFAIDQLTRDEELLGEGRHGSVASTQYPVERIVPDEGLGYYTTTTTTQPVEKLKQEPQILDRCDTPVSNILRPATPPSEGHQYPPLNFVPLALRPLALISLTTICLAMMAALIFCIVWSQRHAGLWAYDGLGGSRYFVVRFLPSLLAILITLWLFVVQSAIYRILPLTMLASGRGSENALQKIPFLPRNFLFPDITPFRHGEWLTGSFLAIAWAVNIFTVPLQSSLFVPRYYDQVESFQWATTRGIAGTLIALYGLLAITVLGIMLRFSWRESGLLWDPVCVADIIPLIQKSNVLDQFHRTEISQAVEQDLLPRTLRLGYWSSDINDQEFLYGIGEECATGEKSSSNPKRESQTSVPEHDTERQHLNNKDSFERNIHSPFIRYRWTEWFLRDTCVVAWIVIANVLMIAFIVVTFVKQPIRDGFDPLLPTLPSLTSFSSSNFLYSFVPSLIGIVLFLLWQPIDQYFRAVQPFCDLSSPNGALAERSLLLNYPSCLPLEVTFLALSAGHYKVAYTSFMSLASLVIPVLAGGIFMARFYPAHDQIRISTLLPAYYTLMAFVIIYALSFLVLWPRRKRYLPHAIYSYADIISFLYQSPLLSDKVFRQPRTKADLVTRVIVAPPGEGEKALYAFGLYQGRDGQEHLGVDRLRRVGQVEMFVTLDDGSGVV